VAAGACERATREDRGALPNDWLVVGTTLWVALMAVALLGVTLARTEGHF
jgi:hypothetical protein